MEYDELMKQYADFVHRPIIRDSDVIAIYKDEARHKGKPWPPQMPGLMAGVDIVKAAPIIETSPSPDHIWDMLVLAARSSRYD